MHKKLIKVVRSDLMPLEIKWSCFCTGKEMCYTRNECVHGYFFLDECAWCGCVGVVEVQLSTN